MLSLTLVRMLPVAIAMIGSGARTPTVAFLGWFGPRGLASIVFAVIVVEEAHLPGRADDPGHHLCDDRAVGPGARHHRGAAGRPLRPLVRITPPDRRPVMESVPAPSTARGEHPAP